jgi:ATP phosphoribosyltransferase regulatory subunit HisZ
VARRERGAARRAGRALLEVAQWGVPADLGALGAAAERVAALVALAAELAARHPRLALEVDLAEFATSTLDPRLGAAAGPRGYYDGLVFRAYLAGGAVPVGSGGRYDRLFHRLGAPLTAAGFSFGLDRLLAAAPRADEAAAEAAAERAAAPVAGGPP